MATRLVKHLECDLSGVEDDTVDNVLFGLDGDQFEIDLTGEHQDALREALAPYLEVARPWHPDGLGSKRTGTPSRRISASRMVTVLPAPQETIRAWGKAHGHDVSDRGRIRQSVVDAYERAHPLEARR